MTIRELVLKRNRPSRAAGFTLIEILLVIVIILLLAGALVVFVLPQQEGAEKNTTKLLLSNLASALDMYRLNIGHYPTEQEGGLKALLTKPTYENEKLGEKWQGPYVKPGTKMQDPWSHDIVYEVEDLTVAAEDKTKTRLPYKLYSVGPDGQPDTEDDIKYLSESDAETDSTGTGTQ
ncbi:MAG: type II secretion system major pseudopilin GspG [Verrucomicrobia bacterium]|nr:type II secretion system major pseudopilin GspG [Verrucomicrobiota bacterium]